MEIKKGKRPLKCAYPLCSPDWAEFEPLGRATKTYKLIRNCLNGFDSLMETNLVSNLLNVKLYSLFVLARRITQCNFLTVCRCKPLH